MAIILLFDDLEENRTVLSEQLNGRLSNEDSVQLFDGTQELRDDETYEDCIERWLRDTQNIDDILLIACDKELGKFQRFRGLSANAVSAVARNLGVPFCQYARNQGRGQRVINRFRALSRWDSEDITLDEDTLEGWAKEIAATFAGFRFIQQAYATKPELLKQKPAQALAEIAGRSESATRISLYGSGDQSVLTEVFAFQDTVESERGLEKRMPRILGTWLRLSLLRFPGVLVDSVAAASFLNISEVDFAKERVKDLFSSAAYSGPFADLDSWWWRDELEAICLDSGAEDGRSLANVSGQDVAPCLDEEGDSTGYYCMITRKPVSRLKSVGDINWFPSGADLARIHNDAYDKLTSIVRV